MEFRTVVIFREKAGVGVHLPRARESFAGISLVHRFCFCYIRIELAASESSEF